jgi:hypothetical protein
MHPLVGDLSGKTADELLETMSTLHNRLGAVRRSGNTDMAGQLLNVIATYQAEFDKRRMAEIKSAEQNPIFKDSLDIG